MRGTFSKLVSAPDSRRERKAYRDRLIRFIPCEEAKVAMEAPAPDTPEENP